MIMLGLALALGAVAVFLARDWLESQVQPVAVEKPTLPLTTVVVSRAKLAYGNRIAAEHVREIRWPLDSVPTGAFKTVDELFGKGEERVVLRPVSPGEPILPGKVSGFGEKATLSTILEKHMRAVTIRINDTSGVAGFVLPGDKVDILLTRDDAGRLITDILLQNVKILGMDQKVEDVEGKPRVAKAATLEVTPVQAQKIALAQRIGQLSFMLRSISNAAPAERQTISVTDLRIGEINASPQPQIIQPVAAVPEPATDGSASTAKVVRALPPEPKPRKKKKKVVNRFTSVKIIRGLARTTEQVPKEGSQSALSQRSSPVELLPQPSIRGKNFR